MKQIRRTLKGLIYAWIIIAFALSIHTVPVFAEETEPENDWTKTGNITQSVTLNKDVTIGGDLNVAAGLNLNHHTLTVEGDIIICNTAVVDIAGGTLITEKSLTISGNNSAGAIKMITDADTIEVAKDFITYSSSGYNVLTAGTIYIGGDFKQFGPDSHFDPGANTTSTHTVILNGTGKQTIRFEANDVGTNNNYFNIIQVEDNYSGEIHISRTFNFKKLGSDMSVIFDTPEGTDAEEDSYVFINKAGANCDLNGKKLSIKGDVGFLKNLDINGGILEIEGSLYEKPKSDNPLLKINGGTLRITGDYEISGASSLDMGNEADNIYIGGNLTFASSGSYNDFSAGTIYLGGDFTQKGKSGQFSPGQNNASTNKVILNGTGRQTIRFEATEKTNCFNEIGVDDNYSGDVHISRTFNFRKLITDMTVTSDVPKEEDIEEEAAYGFINKSGPTECDLNGKRLLIKGDIGFVNELNLNGGVLEVNGNFHHANTSYGTPTLKVNKGTLKVNGDYMLIDYAAIYMTDSKDSIHVTGNFVMKSDSSPCNRLNNGTLYIGGNLTQTGSTAFSVGKDFVIIFNGKNLQTVSIETVSFPNVYNIGINKNKDTGYVFPEDEDFMWGEFFCTEHSGGTATCKDKAKCIVLGEEYGEFDPNNHVGGTEIRNAKAATDTEKGYTGDTYCKGCGAKLTSGTEIPVKQKQEDTKPDDQKQEGTKPDDIQKDKETTTPEAPKQESAGTELKDTTSNATVEVTNPGTVVDGKVVGAEVSYKKPAETAATVSIPDTVKVGETEYAITSIEKEAFKDNTTITSVTVGENVKTIDSGAFANCKNLKTVKIGNKVETIGNNAFAGNAKLTTVNMGSNVTTIGDKAFQKCSSLKKVTIPATVTKVGKDAFSGCTKMTSATIGKNVKSIGANAFSGNKKLKTVTIKSSKVPTIGKNAFKGLPKNATIKVPKKLYKDFKKKLTTKTGFKKTMNLKKV